MNPDQPIRLSSGHCCVCSGICGHIGPVHLCARHAEAERRRSYAEPERRSGERRITHDRRLAATLADTISLLEGRLAMAQGVIDALTARLEGLETPEERADIPARSCERGCGTYVGRHQFGRGCGWCECSCHAE